MLWRLVVRLYESGEIDGLWIAHFGDDEFSRVEEALHLIKLYDPIRYARLSHDLDGILVRLLPGSRGCFKVVLRSCDLDRRFVLAETTTPELIASVIVHEAAHARLMDRGIGYEPGLRARVEAICMRRQIAFAARLPGGEQAREEAERSLAFYPPDYWTDEALRDRTERGGSEALRYLGAPEFLVRAMLCLGALATRIRRLSQRLRHFLRGMAVSCRVESSAKLRRGPRPRNVSAPRILLCKPADR